MQFGTTFVFFPAKNFRKLDLVFFHSCPFRIFSQNCLVLCFLDVSCNLEQLSFFCPIKFPKRVWLKVQLPKFFQKENLEVVANGLKHAENTKRVHVKIFTIIGHDRMVPKHVENITQVYLKKFANIGHEWSWALTCDIFMWGWYKADLPTYQVWGQKVDWFKR